MKLKLLFLIFVWNFSNAQTYSFSTPTPIPDGLAGPVTGCGSAGTPGSVTTIINVPLSTVITDPTKVTINLDLSHTWLGDVVAQLSTPSGASCALIKRLEASTDTSCGDGSDFATGNIFSFNAANTALINVAIGGNNAVIAGGNFAPTDSPSTYPAAITKCNLTTLLNGTNVNGDWSLTLYDHGQGDTGSLNSWQLVFATGFGLDSKDYIFTNSVSVLGNPFSEQLSLKMNGKADQQTSIHIYTIDGREVFSKKYTINPSQTITIETSNWQQGIYILVPEVDGKKMKAIKVAKN
jgi:subtilisin-like proprotein convertase family protein